MLINVSMSQALDLTIAYIFHQIHIFDILTKHAKSPVSTDDLAKETNTDPTLLGALIHFAPDNIPFGSCEGTTLKRSRTIVEIRCLQWHRQTN